MSSFNNDEHQEEQMNVDYSNEGNDQNGDANEGHGDEEFTDEENEIQNASINGEDGPTDMNDPDWTDENLSTLPKKRKYRLSARNTLRKKNPLVLSDGKLIISELPHN